ncbi:transglutaminase family protein [Nocardioides bruguierae]|uniref:transglutaminase family protein n=1 Tax=Nocardioides bruguierae TaxID=2945102 RepID=UPI002021D84D|nr:transglutaminase family protein [Nocardioides bruguierae]MCL8024041.1 transglutaminase family protein [Nocardioides bruguierae]
MSIKVALEHRTTYDFDRPINVGPHVVRLRPAPHTRTPIDSYTLKVEPAGHFINWQQDAFGNWLARLVFPEKVKTLDITVGLVADMITINPFDFFVEEYAETFPFTYAEELRADLAPYMRDVEDAGEVDAWREKLGLPMDVRTVDFLANLNAAVQAEIGYSVRMEPGVQTPDHTLESKIGSCRDSAWMLVSLLRQYGLAARFVSGYLVQLSADQESLDGPSGPEADFTDLHAWTEVFVPGAGWIGLDPTSALFAGEGHIPLSATPHPSSSAPIEGATDKTEVEFSFSNTVTRVHEDPRVTKPYTDEAWSRVDAVAQGVDARLEAGDVRLTMGGEPTFVALDDQTSDEWNTDADGPHKRALARELAERLRAVYADGGVVHRGQGKWYPGEPLPRWNIALQWRSDGVPLWSDPALLAEPWDDEQAYEDAHERAEKLAYRVTRSLGLPAEQLRPAYEDPFLSLAESVARPHGEKPELDLLDPAHVAALEAEAALDEAGPVDVGPVVADKPKNLEPHGVEADPVRDSDGEPGAETLRDPSDPTDPRAGTQTPSPEAEHGEAEPVSMVDRMDAAGLELIQRLDEAVTEPTGWVLPLTTGEEWTSPQWRLRRGRLVLSPGTSAVGLRLPLDSISWVDPDPDDQPSYLEAGEPLEPSVPKVDICAPDGAPTTAVAFEARDGHVHVFLPPTARLEDYTDLLKIIEVAARRLEQPVVLEGYGPPPDARLTSLTVTPDPGVIEVNVQPTRSWTDLRDLTETLYDQARRSRLTTEKFDLDGLHTGTGGGNHITLGGHQPVDSPMLRRPDLLVSLLRYWQRHPSLSYLFSGRFIGPTSQAPRFDEARPEAVYEMEIAFAEIARITDSLAWQGLEPRPWLVDRALRHLLVDLTGNTHRAEFCIDKMYSPDSSRGRLGLLELRGFEMPPHPQMALVQALLVRSLVAMFWERPNHDPLVRWGTGLHERFLLPQGTIADIAEVAADLRGAGIAFEESWLDPFTEFRFPRIGVVRVPTTPGMRPEQGGTAVELELRQAIEPWMVLGEEATAGGTSRYVDSSVERMQVTVRDFDPGRQMVTVNGVPVPLAPTGRPGEYYAGVRYRAWQPWSALHPSIGVHAPLHVDVVDTVNQVSLGGATYHVSHPGGRSYDVPPVNANEAESRRLTRFEPRGHTPGLLDVAGMRETGRRAASAETPHTLDLRRAPGPLRT